jgi:thiol-disulfide isomerase/thioredoxin
MDSRIKTLCATTMLLAGCGATAPSDQWQAALELAGGPLRFGLEFDLASGTGRMCSGSSCQGLSSVTQVGDSVILEIGDYAATIVALPRGDSLVGEYRNVGNRGPRVIPFVARRGAWPAETDVPASLAGDWNATYFREDGRTSPRVFSFEATEQGLEGTVISNTGDYGRFWGRADADSFSMAHFDGSFVYMLTGTLRGDTLEGLFHAGARTQSRWKAVRVTEGSASHLRDRMELTRVVAPEPFHFSFPDLDGHMVTSEDERFRGKVVLVDIFGTWCPTCHDAAPSIVQFYRDYHDRGLEVVGLAYEVTGDSAIDNAQVRRYRDKFGIEFPLLLGGINITSATAATLPQLEGFTAYPTTIFIGRDGMVRKIHAGFMGPATGAQHDHLLQEFAAIIEELLEEPA